MGIWILIAAIVISENGSGVALINQEFTSQQRCEAAKEKFLDGIDSDKVKVFGDNRAICVPK
jgi:hypothetical protein